jgi:hypothetical protein
MTIDELLALSSRDGRVCPQPRVWETLWKMLPNKSQTGSGWEPPLPLILTAWWYSSDSDKLQRFHCHLRWAHDHGASEQVANLLHSLKADDWYTGQ